MCDGGRRARWAGLACQTTSRDPSASLVPWQRPRLSIDWQKNSLRAFLPAHKPCCHAPPGHCVS
eukprot:12153754-Alexandrium_andersonii.AAC.1